MKRVRDRVSLAIVADEESPYPVLPYDPAAPPGLAPGQGGIAVHASHPAGRSGPPPIVGVDGMPVTRGWGQALVVVPAGEHLVEVQYATPQQTSLVAVGDGEIVSVAYAASEAAVRAASPDSYRSGLGAAGWSLPRGLAIPLGVGIAMALGYVASLVGVVLPLGLATGREHFETVVRAGAAGWVVCSALILYRLWPRMMPRSRRRSARGRRPR